MRLKFWIWCTKCRNNLNEKKYDCVGLLSSQYTDFATPPSCIARLHIPEFDFSFSFTKVRGILERFSNSPVFPAKPQYQNIIHGEKSDRHIAK